MICVFVVLQLCCCTALAQEIPKAQESVAKSNTESLLCYILALLMFIGVIIQSLRLRKIKKEREDESNEHDEQIQGKDDEIRQLRGDMSILEATMESEKAAHQNSHDTQKKYYEKKIAERDKLLKIIHDRYEKALKLHENLDAEVDELIIKEENQRAAAEFDSEYSSLETEEPLSRCKENGTDWFDTFEKLYLQAFAAYDALTPEQKKYTTTDMFNVCKRYDEGKAQKRKEDAQS